MLPRLFILHVFLVRLCAAGTQEFCEVGEVLVA
jgi:hypothetical protein